MISTLTNTREETLAGIKEEMGVRKTSEVFLLFPLGSQFDHLIQQCLAKLGVFCLVADPGSIKAADVQKVKPTGIILSGGPVSVYRDPPPFDSEIFDLGIPVLGICLGFQLWAAHIGCEIAKADKKEFGVHLLSILKPSELFKDCPDGMPVLESHGDIVNGRSFLWFEILAKTENSPVAAGQYKHLYGVQFHPEVTETIRGAKIFENFCFKICGAKDRYPAEEVTQRKIKELREKIGGQKVLLALSGGSDSSTVAYLLKNALKGRSGQLRGVYIKGIDRPDDEKCVRKYFDGQDWIEIKVVDAAEEFLTALKGKISMPRKRVAMRGVYKEVLEREIKLFNADFIAQGTLYTDISESGGGYKIRAKKARIKLHHNVKLGFSVEELMPLSDCVKDSGRDIGRSISVPEELLVRHPFPGPGLIVRIEGKITPDKLRIARQIDDIYIGGLRQYNLYESVWQAGAVITRSVATGTKGDDAASGLVIALWGEWSTNGFTAQAAELPWDSLKMISDKITNEVPEAVSVLYRLSGKPPATIEWG